jgi:RNAse (barnase) inhibitor barstar
VPLVRVPTQRITDWDSFHDVFAKILGFPDFYGRNMDAWIDCVGDADEDNGMTAIAIPAADVLTLELEDVDDFAARCPDQYQAIVECSAFVNWRRIDQGQRPIVALSFHKS